MDEKEKKELEEKQLNDVNGGGWYSSIKTYKSGDEPRFSIGENVTVEERNFRSSPTLKRGKIIEILSKSSNVYSEYRYKVQYEDGSVEDDVFESQMLYEYKNNVYKRPADF